MQFEFTGLLHRAGALFDERQFDGDENAIVDLKYSSSPKDYMVVRSSRERVPGARKMPRTSSKIREPEVLRSDFKSCTSFIAMVAEQRFGFNPASVADLVH